MGTGVVDDIVCLLDDERETGSDASAPNPVVSLSILRVA